MTMNMDFLNATYNDSAEENLRYNSPLYVLAVFMAILILMTIVGNVFVIIAILIYKPLRNVQNFYIISLAVADLAVVICVVPFHVSNFITGYWIFGGPWCDIWLTCDILLCTASILNLCAIALDRYFAIHDPVQYAKMRTLKKVLLIVFVVWFASAVISVPPLFGWSDSKSGSLYDLMSMKCQLTKEKSFVVYSACGSFFIPLIIMSFVYLKIFMATRERLRRRAKQSAASKMVLIRNRRPPSPSRDHENQSDDSTDNNDTSTKETHSLSTPLNDCKINRKKRRTRNNTVSNFFDEKQRISLSKERSAARTLGIIMGAFVFCWLPFFMVYIITPFCPNCHLHGSTLEMTFVILGYVNSGINPIIYTVFNLEFRKAFKFICKKKICFFKKS